MRMRMRMAMKNRQSKTVGDRHDHPNGSTDPLKGLTAA